MGPRGCAAAAVAWVIAALLAACGGPPPPQRLDWLLFGSPASLEIRGMDPAAAKHAAQAVAAGLAPLHHAWHPWEDGELARLNRALASGETVALTPLLAGPLQQAAELHARSGGLFDPALGGLVRLWGFHSSDFPVRTPPPDAAVLAAWRADPPRLADLELLPGGRARSRHPRLQLDLNALAEGLAAARAGRQLQELGVRHALLTLGGDVFALGRAGDRPWQVGVRDPHGDALAGIALSGPEALFSSGNYHKYREEDGVRWPHVLDPRTARPATGTAATAVLHPDPILADATATALLIAGPDGFADLVRQMRTPCALLLTDDDTLVLTRPMHARLMLLRTPERIRVIEHPARDCAEE